MHVRLRVLGEEEELAHRHYGASDAAPLSSAQFTCFTGTKVQIMTLHTDTKAPPTLLRSRVLSVYLLYWYKY